MKMKIMLAAALIAVLAVTGCANAKCGNRRTGPNGNPNYTVIMIDKTPTFEYSR